jgi:hypothetical protein
MRKEIGNYFIDISKLVFGGVVLSAVFDIQAFSKYLVILSGIIATLVFATIGFLLLKKH